MVFKLLVILSDGKHVAPYCIDNMVLYTVEMMG